MINILRSQPNYSSNSVLHTPKREINWIPLLLHFNEHAVLQLNFPSFHIRKTERFLISGPLCDICDTFSLQQPVSFE